MTKQLHYFDEVLRSKALEAAEKLAKIVGSTLGPRGRNVIIHKDGRKPMITKDGITISREVRFDDPAMQTAADIIKQASERTSTEAGDGTTTTMVLANAILQRARSHFSAGVAPIEIKRGIDLAVADLEAAITEAAVPIRTIEDILNVATISANNDKTVGKLVAKAVEAAGRDGIVTIEESRSVDTTMDALEGFRFDSGWLSKIFVTDERRNMVRYEDVFVMVTDYDVSENKQIYNALEIIARANKPFLIVANEVEGQALASMITNAARGSMKVVAVKAPRYGEERREILEDLAIATGAKFFSRERGDLLEEVKLTDFGHAKSIEIEKGNTTLIGTGGLPETIQSRLEDLTKLFEAATEPIEAERQHQRLIRMNGGVVIIRVGGSTEIEMVEKKHRIEDALEAIKAAQVAGIVAGGGVALIGASAKCQKQVKKLKISSEQLVGYMIVLSACAEPLRKMAENVGVSPDVICNSVLAEKAGTGYDFGTSNIKKVNMFKAGIIDPAKVTMCALRNAASAAGTLLTADSALIDVEGA